MSDMPEATVVPHYGDDGRSGTYQASGLPDRAQVAWVAATEGEVITSPVLAGGTLLVADVAATLYAFDAATGELRWSHTYRDDEGGEDEEFEPGDFVTQLPIAVWNDLVFVGVSGLDYEFDDSLHVHDLKTGQVVRTMRGQWHPTVAGDLLLLSGDGVRALDLPDLSPRWRSTKLHGWLDAAPAVAADGTAFAARGLEANRTSGGVDAFDVRTGKAAFDRVVDVAIGQDGEQAALVQCTHAVLGDGLVWLPVAWGGDDEAVWSGGGVVGLDPRTGERRAHHLLHGSWLAGTVAVAGGVLYYADEEGDGEPPILGRAVSALDIATGRSLWRFPLKGQAAGAPVVASGVVYVATYSGEVVALDAATGEPRWALALDTKIENRYDLDDPDGEAVYDETGLVVLPADGMLYVRTSGGVVALR
ncbi:PQQ-binding-like beta-propeller repeat protein [Streptomyces sp. NPDC050428]|uniref:outer membrane protein assembly factor BamB family protein n=1 Tax=Streptomyces sp. NPDC050428 TaxID=3155757 RepID=UPI0034290A41